MVAFVLCALYMERHHAPLISGCSSVWLEHLLWEQGVAGSSPVIQTINYYKYKLPNLTRFIVRIFEYVHKSKILKREDVDSMPTTRLLPKSFISTTNMVEQNITHLYEDPSGIQDHNYVKFNAFGYDWGFQIDFDLPPANLVGTQRLRTNVYNPYGSMFGYTLNQNGTFLAGGLYSNDDFFEITFDASRLVDPSGAGITLTFNSNTSPYVERINSIDILANHEILSTVNPDIPQITNSPTNGEIVGTSPSFSAILTDNEDPSVNDKIKLVIEYSDDNFQSNIGVAESIAVSSRETATVIISSALYNETYYWRAKAVDNGGLESGYTPTQTFTFYNALPNIPINLSPANNIVTTNTSFTVSADLSDLEGDTLSMRVQLSDTKDFSNILRNVTASSPISNNTYQYTFRDLTQGNYYWRAMAVDSNNTASQSDWTAIRGVFVDIPSTGRLAPTSILEQTNLSGSVTAIDEDPDSADTSWLTSSSDADTIVRVGFPTPILNLETGNGLQNFRVRVKASNGSGTGTVIVSIYENGIERASQSFSAGGAGQNVQLSWNANLLSNPSGADVECRVVGQGVYGGNPSSRFRIDIGAIEWNYQTINKAQDPAPEPIEPIAPNVPTNITPTNDSTVQSLDVSATITDTDSTAKLVVEYSTTSDFSSNVQTIESAMVTSGSVANVTLSGTYSEDTVIYMRMWADDGSLTSSIVTSSFTYQVNSGGGSTDPDPQVTKIITLKPTSMTLTNLTPNDITYIQDDPNNASDTTRLNPVSVTSSPIAKVEFEEGVYELTGIQSIEVNFDDPSYYGLHIEIYEGTTQRYVSGTVYGSQVSSFDFETNVLSNPTNENIVIHIIGHSNGVGTISGIKAVQWTASVLQSETGGVGDGYIEDPNYLTPTNLFPFNGSAWNKIAIKATPTTVDGSQVKLGVIYSKTLDFAVKWEQESTYVPSGTEVEIVLDQTTFVDGDMIYWQVKSGDGTHVSVEPSPIHDFTYKPNGWFSPEGTEFMQQGDPDTHYRIIDVSEYQGTIDWQAVKDSGVNHVYLRAYGSSRTLNNGNGDANFETYIQQANAVGIKTGAYFYTMPSVPLDLAQARYEADLFIAKLESGYGTGQYGDLMPMMDLEDNTGVSVAGQAITDLSVEDTMQWANEFRNYFEQQTGRVLGLYTGDNFVRDTMNNFNHDDATGQAVIGTSGNLIQDMPLWIQGYIKYDRYQGYVMPSCGGWTKWYIFQYSEEGTQAGIVGNVDQNLAEPIEWVLEPKDVNNVSISGNSDITVMWDANTEEDIEYYTIYLNGFAYDGVLKDTNSFVIPKEEFNNSGDYQIGVKAQDFFGDESRNISFTTYSYTAPTLQPAPKVNIISVSRLKISDEPEFDKADIRFSFDVDTKAFTVNVNGVDHTTGLVAHSGGGKTVIQLAGETVLDLSMQTVQQISIIVAGMEIIAEVDWTELSTGENRVNIYGQNTDGVWTPYDTGVDTTPPEDVADLSALATHYSVQLSWTHSISSDRQDYIIYDSNGVEIGSTVNNFFEILELQPVTTYTFRVATRDVDGNISDGVEVVSTTNDFR
jgi:GH25 family lysozyme M1 (1,4-beta-N-acetylmuramidase)